MREVVLDTETTGLSPADGHRIVEIGCVELIDRMPSGKTFHVYLDPEREVPVEAANIHGLTTEMLRGKPKFAEVVEEFIEFITDTPLIIHNASFDMMFIDAELKRAGLEPWPRHQVIDTLMIARRKHPGAQNSLDALCTRYGIDRSKRDKHGALLDSELLASVYIELIGEKQATMRLANEGKNPASIGRTGKGESLKRPTPLKPIADEQALTEHKAYIESLSAQALWKSYFSS
jgi:DNA polymerase III subunit epsilon